VDTTWHNLDRPNNLMVIEAFILLDGVPDRDEVIGQGPGRETLNGLRARVEGAR
jgi:hypothetical protein